MYARHLTTDGLLKDGFALDLLIDCEMVADSWLGAGVSLIPERIALTLALSCR